MKEVDPDDFIPGIDLEMMYREMYLASEGCLWEYLQRGSLDMDAMQKEFEQLVEFWKKVYLRREREDI